MADIIIDLDDVLAKTKSVINHDKDEIFTRRIMDQLTYLWSPLYYFPDDDVFNNECNSNYFYPPSRRVIKSKNSKKEDKNAAVITLIVRTIDDLNEKGQQILTFGNDRAILLEDIETIKDCIINPDSKICKGYCVWVTDNWSAISKVSVDIKTTQKIQLTDRAKVANQNDLNNLYIFICEISANGDLAKSTKDDINVICYADVISR